MSVSNINSSINSSVNPAPGVAAVKTWTATLPNGATVQAPADVSLEVTTNNQSPAWSTMAVFLVGTASVLIGMLIYDSIRGRYRDRS